MTTHFAWLEITGKCQLTCQHCYADSGPSGTHGRMQTVDWQRVIDQLVLAGVTAVQFIGGEPMLHPDLALLVEYALNCELRVEVFSNLVHVPRHMWSVLERPGASLATSYYSDDPAEHAVITQRPTHAHTRANIEEAVRRRIPLRAGVIEIKLNQRSTEAQADLADLGVDQIEVDHLRKVGRGAGDFQPDASQLCGHCASGVIAISPDGEVWPCVFSRWLSVGNVMNQELTDILISPEADRVRVELQSGFDHTPAKMPCVPNMCDPQCGPSCSPACRPAGNCRPAGGCVPSY